MVFYIDTSNKLVSSRMNTSQVPERNHALQMPSAQCAMSRSSYTQPLIQK